ncbi:exocyst complex component Sec6 [Patellaria atrata CBS 101060]|uniref:Exocyst complex component Sec6 n=1 Tax=Patellaria atrata CBS 101060 TaxID=1346257 RepID=A0A9P4SCW3_9PEZI|nr:exocyst complex component Sec6 [Patellaria atrata CBS 101060]
MNDAEAATVKLAELLRHPEDLDKIPALVSEFTRKKAAIDLQLRVGLKEQLEITQTGMNSISEGQRTVNLIKDEMMKIDKLCAEAQNMIRDFPHINTVAQTHRNFELVERLKRDVESFDERLGSIEYLLKEDDREQELQPNLLQIHRELTQLRDIRDSAMDRVKGEDDTVLELIQNLRLESGSTLQDYFGRLDEVVDWFDEHVGSACMNLIPLVHAGNTGLIVRLALVIQEEEKNDKKVKALQDAQREYKELASRFKSIATGPKELRGYKEKFLEAIKLSASNQMAIADEAFLDDPEKLNKAMKWYFNDLNTVKLGMSNLMPRKWKIFQTYINIYHNLMHDFLLSHINNEDLTPAHMLAIIHWEEAYYTKMGKLGIPEDQLPMHLLDNRGPDIVREYRQLIIKAVDQWMDRMGVVDKQNFLARQETALEADEQGCFRTKTLADMWRMLREQLAVAGSSDRHDVVEGVVDAMFRALRARQQMWQELIDAELAKYSATTAEPEGLNALQDWLISIANDQIVNIDDADDGSDRISHVTRFTREIQPLISPTYLPTLQSQTETLSNGYVDLATHAINIFVALIFALDFRPILPEFFTPSWYGKKGMAQLLSTFDDYLSDYHPVLHPSLRDVLLEDLADSLLRAYLLAVRNRGARFRRADPWVDKIRDDITAVFTFFSTRAEANFPDIKAKWKAVDGMVRLVECEKAAVADVWRGFKEEWWDASASWAESVLRARDDFERAMLAGVRAGAADVEPRRAAETIMARVK